MLEPGLVVQGRYRVVGPLGKGGMGTTYVAEDLERGVEVALKVLSMQSMSDWKVLELFEREARVLASLKHPRSLWKGQNCITTNKFNEER